MIKYGVDESQIKEGSAKRDMTPKEIMDKALEEQLRAKKEGRRSNVYPPPRP